MFNNFFLENLAVYEIMSENFVHPDWSQKIQRMCNGCWIPKATDTLSEYVILLFHCNNGCTNAPDC